MFNGHMLGTWEFQLLKVADAYWESNYMPWDLGIFIVRAWQETVNCRVEGWLLTLVF